MKYLGVPQSGSQANTVASRNRYGQYYRNRATPINPATSKQGAVRAAFGTQAAVWSTLTGAQQAAWATWAINHPTVDTLGQAKVLSGFSAFLACNLALLAVASTPITDPPAEPVWPDLLMTVTQTTTSTSIVFTPPTVGYVQSFWAGPPRSAGTNFEGNYRLIAQAYSTDMSPATPQALYVAAWGAPLIGQVVFWRSQICAGGQRCPWIYQRRAIIT